MFAVFSFSNHSLTHGCIPTDTIAVVCTAPGLQCTATAAACNAAVGQSCVDNAEDKGRGSFDPGNCNNNCDDNGGDCCAHDSNWGGIDPLSCPNGWVPVETGPCDLPWPISDYITYKCCAPALKCTTTTTLTTTTMKVCGRGTYLKIDRGQTCENCPRGQFQDAPDHSNLQCLPAADCDDNEYVVKKAQTIQDTICGAIGECVEGEYEFKAPQPGENNRVCKRIRECRPGQFVETPATATSNRRCADCDRTPASFEGGLCTTTTTTTTTTATIPSSSAGNKTAVHTGGGTLNTESNGSAPETPTSMSTPDPDLATTVPTSTTQPARKPTQIPNTSPPPKGDLQNTTGANDSGQDGGGTPPPGTGGETEPTSTPDTPGSNRDANASTDGSASLPEEDESTPTIVGAVLGGVVLLLAIAGVVRFYQKRNIATANNNANVAAAAAATVQNRAFGINLNMQATYGEVESRVALDAAGSHVQQAYGGVQPAGGGAARSDAGTIEYAAIDEALAAAGDLEDPEYLEPVATQPALYDGVDQAIQQNAAVETGTCARGTDSGGRACKRPVGGGELYCDNHRCGRAGCSTSKSSSDAVCRHHVLAGVRPRAPTGVGGSSGGGSSGGIRRNSATRKPSTYAGFGNGGGGGGGVDGYNSDDAEA